MQYKYHNRSITEQESALELAKIFDIDLSKADDIGEDNEKVEGNYYMQGSKALSRLKDQYTIRDYQAELRQVRVQRDTLNMFSQTRMINRSIIKMIATGKNLYE